MFFIIYFYFFDFFLREWFDFFLIQIKDFTFQSAKQANYF